MSQASQPSASISARLMGRNGAGWRGRACAIRGVAAVMIWVSMRTGIGLRAREYNRRAREESRVPASRAAGKRLLDHGGESDQARLAVRRADDLQRNGHTGLVAAGGHRERRAAEDRP